MNSTEELGTRILCYTFNQTNTLLFVGTTKGFRIIRVEDGKNVNIWQAFLREWVGRIVSSILYIGYIYAGFDAYKQGFHDKIARTYVVKK